VLSAIAIVPSAPVLVPELAGAAAAEVADLRAATIAAAALLPSRWIAVGTGDADQTVKQNAAGTFAGFGVDVPVRLSPQADSSAELPLCALMAAWVRGQARPEASAHVRVLRRDHVVEVALAQGRRLRAEIEAASEPVGVLIVADGANTLTPKAPGAFDPGAADAQQALDEALACGDVSGLRGLSPLIVGRVAFQVMAGLTEPGPRWAKELYRGAPYGVGYFAGVWQL